MEDDAHTHQIRSTHVKSRMDGQRHQFGTVLTGKGQSVCGSGEKIECAQEVLDANIIIVLHTNRCELGVVFCTKVIHTLDPLNLESFRLQARPGQGDF